MNSWNCKTVFVDSPALRNRIETLWESMKHRLDKCPIAHHMMVKCSDLGSPLLEECDSCQNTVRPKKKLKLLDVWSHGPKDVAPLSFVASNHFDVEKATQEVSASSFSFESFKMRYFSEESLPDSFKYPTIRLKMGSLPQPNMLGVNSKPLQMSYDDGVHMKFASPTFSTREISDENVHDVVNTLRKNKRYDSAASSSTSLPQPYPKSARGTTDVIRDAISSGELAICGIY